MNLISFYNLKLYFWLYPERAIGAGIIVAALLALAGILIVRRIRRKTAEEGQSLLSSGQKEQGNQKQSSGKQNNWKQSNGTQNEWKQRNGKQSWQAGRDAESSGQAAGRQPVMQMPSDPRTVLMSYSGLVLRDTRRPGSCYRASLTRPVTVGRSRENTICIADESVSRQHLRIYRDGGCVMVENLSQKNGTLLEGVRLTGARELCTGNILDLGRVSLKAEID